MGDNKNLHTIGTIFKIGDNAYLSMNDGKFYEFIVINEIPSLIKLSVKETNELAHLLLEKRAKNG